MAVLPTGIGPVTGYNIERSLRFNSADSAYLNRTFGTPTNNLKWTWSGWVKKGTGGCVFGHFNTSGVNQQHLIYLNDSDITFHLYNSAYLGRKITTQVNRDPSAWFHLLVVWDTANATASDRMQLWKNGVRITAFSTSSDPSLNQTGYINAASTVVGIGDGRPSNASYFDGYLADVYFIDGQALTPSDFGETDSATGVWKPKAYTGTYGTNGFFLKFADNSGTTSTTLGKDSSGNGNNWTPNNFSVTAGAGNDSMVDSPTAYGTDTGVGGSVRGNYCTLNPLWKNSAVTVSDGNLKYTDSNPTNAVQASTFWVSTGKWYWETTITSAGGGNYGLGIVGPTYNKDTYGYNTGQDSYLYLSSGNYYEGSTNSAYGASYTTGDVIGIALDCDAGTITFYKNNTSQGTKTGTNLAGKLVSAMITTSQNTASAFNGGINFGQRAFAYTAPSGFKALCTTNLPTPTIGATSTTQANDYFDVTLYTGTDATQTITNSGSMQPDLVWVKSRNSAYNHYLYDSIRGATNALRSSTTGAESQAGDSTLTTTTNGFTVTGTGLGVNSNGTTIVGWQWNAGGSTVTNTSGTISAQVRANTTAGFSIVTYTGNDTSGATVGHGLGVAPSMFIVKTRSQARGWNVYHTSLGNTKYIQLQSTAAPVTSSAWWNNTSPSSTTFTLGNDPDVNGSTQNYVAYVFAPVAGYSAFGSYTGNGSTDGPFVYLGFRPEFVMIKNATTAGTSWEMFDNARETSNLMDLELLANSSAAEGTYTYGDFVSNGFKLRSTNNGVNQSSATLIYMAFAENPFKYSLAR